MRRRGARIAAVADVPEHIPGLDVGGSFERKALEMRVVERFAGSAAAQPHHVAAQVVGAGSRSAVDHRQRGRVARGKDVDAFMLPAPRVARGAELALHCRGREAADVRPTFLSRQ